jgi:hypothetical protein
MFDRPAYTRRNADRMTYNSSVSFLVCFMGGEIAAVAFLGPGSEPSAPRSQRPTLAPCSYIGLVLLHKVSSRARWDDVLYGSNCDEDRSDA